MTYCDEPALEKTACPERIAVGSNFHWCESEWWGDECQICHGTGIVYNYQ